MKIKLLDTENGRTSVANLIRAGYVEAVYTPTFQALETEVNKLIASKDRDFMLVIDTVTTTATKTRQDLTVDPKDVDGKSIWDLRFKLQSDQKQWNQTTDSLLRLFGRIRSSNIPCVLIAHENEREDPSTGLDKFGPAFNPALRDGVFAMCDVIARYSRSNAEVKIGDTVFPRGTRVLRMEGNDSAIAGYRNPDPDTFDVPEVVFPKKPGAKEGVTLQQLATIFGGELPHGEGVAPFIVIYGPPKIGKTTMVCSFAKPQDTEGK